MCPLDCQVARATAAVSLEREAAIITEAVHENNKAAGALDFDLQVQDMSKVWHSIAACGYMCMCVQPMLYSAPCRALRRSEHMHLHLIVDFTSYFPLIQLVS
jgi:hypothetical protein